MPMDVAVSKYTSHDEEGDHKGHRAADEQPHHRDTLFQPKVRERRSSVHTWSIPDRDEERGRA